MSDPAVHIAAWQAAGLIDAALAERLRQAAFEGADGASLDDLATHAVLPAMPDGPAPTQAPTGSFFGPGIAIGEMFGYLGAAFLLGAWITFLARVAESPDREAILTGGLTLAALVTFGLGVFLARGDARRRRGAGIAFVTVTALAAGAAAFLVQLDFLRNTLQGQAPGILVAGVAVAVAIGLRRLLPAVATQLGLLAALTGLAGAVLLWLQELVFPTDLGLGYTGAQATEPVSLVLAAGGWWLLVALGLGFIGVLEARRSGTDGAAIRRANVTRLWAGLVAVAGLSSGLMQSGYLGSDRYGRILEPWIADLALVALVVVLVERAFRRGSNAFIVSAAIGLVVALTDFNFSYLSQSTDVGLVIEGVILLAVGFGGDRLRRRLGGSRDASPASIADDRKEPGDAHG